RPALDSTERRSKVTVMRTTEPELEHIRAQADAAGLSVSEFVRRRSLGYVVPTAAGDARRTDPALIDAVNRVGVNVNQLAASVHMGRSFMQYWEAIGREVEELLERLTADDEGGDDL
ncbi:MAG: hypothetical protein AAFQ17_00130, partial [Pseudomonadota bacterium]